MSKLFAIETFEQYFSYVSNYDLVAFIVTKTSEGIIKKV
ncbi:hypothetical protein F903_03279 [Acinetobacter sp. NIPH 298]|nr:hypothetical protein F903_03279 [Acinetobacter sp. NIPH 298]